jgi:hypothetical protein
MLAADRRTVARYPRWYRSPLPGRRRGCDTAHHGGVSDDSAAVSQPASRDDIGELLRSAWDRLAALDLPHEQLFRLRRQLIAVCDAVKSPAAGTACRRRLDEFLAALESAEKSGHIK